MVTVSPQNGISNNSSIDEKSDGIVQPEPLPDTHGYYDLGLNQGLTRQRTNIRRSFQMYGYPGLTSGATGQDLTWFVPELIEHRRF